MRISLSVAVACLALGAAIPARASVAGSPTNELWSASMQSARWTGPMLASNAETLPQGHFYTEPYFYDVISGGEHSPGSSGFYQYGLSDDFTVGVEPSFAFGMRQHNRNFALGDFKLLSQLRLTHFTPEHRIPTVALVFNVALPTGKFDRLGALKNGHGAGSLAPEIGINLQHYFLLPNDRLLRGRINVLHTLPFETDVSDRSVYGTGPGFRGHAKPGSKTTLIAALEYSITSEWVLALDLEADLSGRTRIAGRYDGGPVLKERLPKSWNVGFAPAVEYNWNDTSGILVGVWIVPKGHNAPASVTPAIAISRFW